MVGAYECDVISQRESKKPNRVWVYLDGGKPADDALNELPNPKRLVWGLPVVGSPPECD
jgi:hypothetical protein